MAMRIVNQWVSALIVTVGLFTGATSYAEVHHHGERHGGYHGNYHGNYHGHYHGGGGYYGPGPGWSGPNIIIGVPSPRYYAPYCETVRVCDQFDRCWLERSCQ